MKEGWGLEGIELKASLQKILPNPKSYTWKIYDRDFPVFDNNLQNLDTITKLLLSNRF